MLTPWQCHQLRLAGENSQATHPLWDAGAQSIALQFQHDKRQLKRIQSTERKAQYKQNVLPHYAPWVSGVLEKGDGEQNDMLMMLMLWHIDTDDLSSALSIAEYAIQHRLLMPFGHTRSTGCAIAEEIAEAAKMAYAREKPVSLSILQQVITLTEKEDMPDVVRAELYKWYGITLRESEQLAAALEILKRALSLNERVGVKGEIKRLEKVLSPDG